MPRLNQPLTGDLRWVRMTTGTMSVRLHHSLALALSGLVAGSSGLRADEAPKGPPTPIIFSAPRSDTVSSNLNQIGTRSSALKNLESGLKQPFEMFDNSRSSGELQPPSRFTPATPSSPVLNNKKFKDALDKRAEESYLMSDDGDSALSGDDLSKSDPDAFDSSGKRPKTSLDRYYDRIDRLKAGQTNQTSRGLDMFGDKDSPSDKDDPKPKKSGGLFDRELSANARVLGQMTNNISEGGRLFSDKLKPRGYGDIFELGPVDSAQTTARTKDTRLDNFKRLLDGPGYGPRSEFNAAPPPSSSGYQPPKSIVGAPSSSLSPSPQPVVGGYANPPGFSGAVGTPAGLPDYAASSPSLTTTPPLPQPAPKQPMPTFSIPRRRF